jgi:hypothetical protein
MVSGAALRDGMESTAAKDGKKARIEEERIRERESNSRR